MKRAKKREPYTSAITDAKRAELIQRVRSRELTDDETTIFLADFRRAQEKHVAALEQMAHPGDVGLAHFKAPDQRAVSASVTLVFAQVSIEHLARSGAKARRAQRKAGLGRHHPANDPETAARHNAWRRAHDAILAELSPENRRKLSQRYLATLICDRVQGSNAETVRGWLKREGNAGRSKTRAS